MSKFSGKCDLYDHMMMEKTYEVNNHYESDEFECFEIFKQKTGGVLHQHHLIKVDKFNRDFVKEHCKEFDYKDNIYTYYNKEYTLKELNKHSVYIETDIHFDSILDLIPYYPYIIAVAACNKDSEYIVTANESYVDQQFKEHLQHGWISHIDYKKKLQDHYLEVCDRLLKEKQENDK